MSLADDQSAEYEEWLETLLDTAVFGNVARTPAFQLAKRLETVRVILGEENGKICLTKPLNWLEQRIVLQTAGLLLGSALTGKLGQILRTQSRPDAGRACGD